MIVYLVDGHAYCYRAFHAIRELRNSKGMPTNVVFGFSAMLKKLVDDFKPDGLAVVFDSKGPTFRHKKFEEYKIHRKPMPEDLIIQMPVVKRLVEAFRIPVLEMQGFEADDIIGTMARRMRAAGHKTVIVTGDKDMMQLVEDGRITLLNPSKDYLVVNEAEVEKKFGVKPGQVVDVLALMGDASDGIPGVTGVGEKTAIQLVKEFGSVEKLYKNLDKIPQEGRRVALKNSKEMAELSHELATIDCSVPVEVTLEQLKVQEPDFARLRELYKELEFRNHLKALPEDESKPRAEKDFKLVADEKSWKTLLKKLSVSKEFALDFETTSLTPNMAEPVGMSFSTQPHEAWFVLFSAHESGRSKLEAGSVLKDLAPLLESTTICKIGQNLKYEMSILRNFELELKGPCFDTMIASYLLNSSKRNHNLDELAGEHLDEKLIQIEELIGKGKNEITMAGADLDLLVKYGCQDADVALRLARILRGKLEEKGLSGLFDTIEMPLVEVLCRMECAGIAIDKKLLKQLSEELGAAIDKLVVKIHKAAKEEFNINSPKQLGEILFTKLGLPVVRKTKSGFSTDVDVLTQLADMHELPRLVLDYRELSKLKSTYVDALPELANPKTGRIHSSFNQTVTETGRLSSNEPNLQNIPVRTEEGRKIRKVFVAEKGFTLLSADYSQIELRILAHFSKDPALKKAFIEGQDVHRYTASLIFGVDPKDVEPKMRETAKTVNFGVLYGMSAFGLSKSLDISQKAAADFIKAYFERYGRIKEYLDQTIEGAKKNGFVETMFKRRRNIPDILSSDVRMRQYAERTAINAPVQGTASDLIKLAMIALDRRIPTLGYDARMLLQVHDELVFEVAKEHVLEFASIVKKEMEGAAELSVPIEVTLKAGSNWCDMEKIRVGAEAART